MERVVINGRGFFVGECNSCGNTHKQRVDKKGGFICSLCKAGIKYKAGDKIGLFTLTGKYTTKFKNGKSKRYWSMICECGNTREYPTNYIQTGKVNNCGCKTKELISCSKIKHGFASSRVYSIWSHIKKRCYNKNSIDYPKYGGRGIIMCDEWVNNPKAFIEWALSNGYKETLTIDRINNDGNYEPLNCQWISNEENAKKDKIKLTENQRQEVVDMFTKKIKQAEIAKHFRVSISTIQRIIKDKKCSRV